MAMLAAALLTIAAAQDPAPRGHIPLTRNGISRLLTTSVQPVRHADPLRWSAWR